VNEKLFLRMAGVVLIVHSLMLGWSITWQSPTLNEPGHLASGVALWELGRFDTYRVNPPLVRAVASLPVVVAGCKTNWDRLFCGAGLRCEFDIGMDFIRSNGADSVRLFNLARWACIPFSVLGGLCCYIWGRALCDASSGLLACVLWCFTPNVLAAGQVIAPDMGGASLGLLASYAFWQWLKRLSWESASVAGATFGLALLARSPWIILFALWPVLWGMIFLWRMRTNDMVARLRDQISQLTSILLLALYLLHSGYLFDGSMTRLGDYQFVSRRLGNPQPGEQSGNVFKYSWLGCVPIPLPKEFLLGLDYQKKDFEAFSEPSYLRGEWRRTGWWYYYIYGFAVKVPLSILCLVSIAACLSVVGFRSYHVNDIAGWGTLCVPGVVTIVILSCQPSLNHHFRYALPMCGPLIVFAGSIPYSARKCEVRLRAVLLSITAVCILSLICSTLTSAPRFISFFNILAGGARNGNRHMIHSNLDWGQGLYFLKEWLQEQKIDKPIRLAYYGYFDPADIGIDYIPATCGPSWSTAASPPKEDSGLLVISVNYLVGDQWRLVKGCDYREFEQRIPIHICGDCLYVYDVRNRSRHGEQ
jgi:hypothetical protein